jgi:hypothetical protein
MSRYGGPDLPEAEDLGVDLIISGWVPDFQRIEHRSMGMTPCERQSDPLAAGLIERSRQSLAIFRTAVVCTTVGQVLDLPPWVRSDFSNTCYTVTNVASDPYT